MRGKQVFFTDSMIIILITLTVLSGCSILSDALGGVNLVISDSGRSSSSGSSTGRTDITATTRKAPKKSAQEAPEEKAVEQPAAEEPAETTEVAEAAEPAEETTETAETIEEAGEVAMADNKEETPAQKPQTKPEAKPETKPEPKPEAKPEKKPEPKPEQKPEAKPEPKPEKKPVKEEDATETPRYTPEVQMFHPLFAQAFYFGGFYAGDDDFKETQGVIWDIQSRTKGQREAITVEKALLKINPDGTRWWYIRYASDDGEFEYEVLADSQNLVRNIRFKDGEGKARGYQFSEADSRGSGAAAGGPAYRFKSPNEYTKYKEGQRTVNVGAGKFRTDYLRVTNKDRGVEQVYEWWITDEVPGKLVQFKWEDKTEKNTTQGELISVKMGYTTRFGSF